MNKMKRRIFFVVIFFALMSNCQAVQIPIFNVKNYGAVGNGKSDDYASVEKCIAAALKVPKSRILFPEGIYLISKEIIIRSDNQEISLEGAISERKKTVLKNNNACSTLTFRGVNENLPLGKIYIKNISIDGSFPQFSQTNPYINKDTWYGGLIIKDKEAVLLENVSVNNIYGEGIHISSSKQTDGSINNRIKKLQIRHCTIRNCWGYNPRNDNYGDGIYLSNIASGEVSDCQIINDFKITGQLGRCGIVIEFMTENCLIQRNEISGYDRGIHIESDYGGHSLIENKISGTDLGIEIYNIKTEVAGKPDMILRNQISNRGLPKGNKLNRTRDLVGTTDRSLLNFTALNSARANSIVEGNSFIVDDKYDYYSFSIANIKADGIKMRNNSFIYLKSGKLARSIKYFNYSSSTPTGDVFNGIQALRFNKSVDTQRIRKMNTLEGSRIEINKI